MRCLISLNVPGTRVIYNQQTVFYPHVKNKTEMKEDYANDD